MTLMERAQVAESGRMAHPEREAACGGYTVDGSGEQAWGKLWAGAHSTVTAALAE